MKRVPINTLLAKLTNLTNSCSREVSENIGTQNADSLNSQPNERSWSAIQCIEHLNAYFRYYIPVIRGKITNSRFVTPNEYFTSSPLGRAVYRSAKLGKVHNVKRHLKSPKDYNPLINPSLSSENSIEEYLQHNSDFLNLIHEAEKIDMRKTKVPLSLRPVAKLNIGDALLFLAYHNERHIYQAKDALRLAKS